jgi:hypothetical protein
MDKTARNDKNEGAATAREGFNASSQVHFRFHSVGVEKLGALLCDKAESIRMQDGEGRNAIG